VIITQLVSLTGAFGIVHKGEMISSDGIVKAVAIKTIKCKCVIRLLQAIEVTDIVQLGNGEGYCMEVINLYTYLFIIMFTFSMRQFINCGWKELAIESIDFKRLQ